MGGEGGLNSLGFTRSHLVSLLVSLGSTWTYLVSLGLTWSHMDTLGLIWFHLVSFWTHLVPLVLTWSYMVLLGSTGTQDSLSSCLELLGLIWFHFDFTSRPLTLKGKMTSSSQGKGESLLWPKGKEKVQWMMFWMYSFLTTRAFAHRT
jgi:hypothetical protein